MGSAFISPVKISNNPRYDYNVIMEANKTYNISNIKNEFNLRLYNNKTNLKNFYIFYYDI